MRRGPDVERALATTRRLLRQSSFYPQVAGQDYLRSAFLKMADVRERNLVRLAGVRDQQVLGWEMCRFSLRQRNPISTYVVT